MIRALPLILLLVLGLPDLALGVTPGELAHQAQKAYEAKRFEDAIHYWTELSSLGYRNGNIFYNISDAYWALGKIGQAKRYLLKAIQLNPRDPDIRDNLKYVQEKLGEGRPAEGLTALWRRIPWWRLSLNQQETLKLTAVLSVLAFGLLTLGRFRNRRKFKRLGYFLMILFALSFFHLLYQFGKQHLFSRAVVIGNSAALLGAPTLEATSDKDLKEGILINVGKKQGNFLLVKTAEGKKGWVEENQVGEI